MGIHSAHPVQAEGVSRVDNDVDDFIPDPNAGDPSKQLDGGEATEEIFFIKEHRRADQGVDTAERTSEQKNYTQRSAKKAQQLESTNVQYGIQTEQMTD